MPTIPPPVAVAVLCAVMREPSSRALDVTHPGCHFFDVTGSVATWAGKTVPLPCNKYDHTCYTKKLVVLMNELLATSHEVFYYVESDNALCAPLSVLSDLAGRYMLRHPNSPGLITTGVGASGWLFDRAWAKAWVASATSCTEWCYCPDCIAAFLRSPPRATTRVVLNQHVTVADSRSGLSRNNNPLPRCYQVRSQSGINKFDFFDTKACTHHDISPCQTQNWGIFAGH